MNYKFSLNTEDLYQPIKEITDEKNSKKYFVFLVIIYLIGYAAILRADVYYNDDVGRSLSGYSGWSKVFGRHLSEWFSKFVHMGWKTSDISPLTQIIAILILSVSSILLVKIVNGRLRFVPILASSCIGLFPYFLENISYKFDSPYMAFSILSSIVPFLWYKSSKKYFVISSIIGVLATLLTYQLASGVYIIILIFLLTKDYLKEKTPLKDTITMMAFSSFSYTIAILMFYYVFMNKTPYYNYVSTSVFSLSELHTGIYSNYKTYFSLIKNNLFDGFIGYAFLFLCLMYPIKLVLMSQRNKMSSIAISLLSFVFMALFLWGG